MAVRIKVNDTGHYSIHGGSVIDGSKIFTGKKNNFLR